MLVCQVSASGLSDLEALELNTSALFDNSWIKSWTNLKSFRINFSAIAKHICVGSCTNFSSRRRYLESWLSAYQWSDAGICGRARGRGVMEWWGGRWVPFHFLSLAGVDSGGFCSLSHLLPLRSPVSCLEPLIEAINRFLQPIWYFRQITLSFFHIKMNDWHISFTRINIFPYLMTNLVPP